MMKKTLFLHIGTFKTGTSAIQKFLCANRDALGHQGFFVPRCDLVGHHELPLSLIQEHTSWRASWPRFRGTRTEVWDEVIRQIEVSESPNVIISSEAFCDVVNENVAPSASEAMGSLLLRYFRNVDVRVLVYLRRLDLYAESMYRENVKNSCMTGAIAESAQSSLTQQSIHLRPSRYLDFFADLFGKERVLVRLYDRSRLHQGDAVCDFMHWLGIRLPDGGWDSQHQVNLSLDGQMVLLKRLFNLAGNQGLYFNQEIAQLLIDVDRVIADHSREWLDCALLDAMRQEARYVGENYGVDIGPEVDDRAKRGAPDAVDDRTSAKVSVDPVSRSEAVLVALLATAIKQNRSVVSRLDSLERRLEGRGNGDARE